MKILRNRKIHIILILIFIILFLFKDLLTRKNIYFNEDTSHFFYPATTFNYINLISGKIPLWNPYRYSGHPWLADIQTSFFYFIDYLIIFFTGIYYPNIVIIIHYAFMFYFMFLFARSLHLDRFSSLLTTIIFTISGFIGETLKVGNLGIIKTITYMPLIFLLITKLFYLPKIKYVILISFVLAIQFFAGHFQFFFYSSFFLLLYIFFSVFYFWNYFKNSKYLIKISIYLFLILIISLLLISIQLLPTYELSKLCTRSYGVPYNFATSNSISPDKLVEFVLCNFYGINERDYIGLTEPNNLGYIGFFPLVLIFSYLFFSVKKNKLLFYHFLFFGLTAILSILLSMGKHSPLFDFFFNNVFGFNFFRSVNRLLIIYVFSASILTGIAFNQLFYQQIKTKIKIIIFILFLIGIFFFLCSTLINYFPYGALMKLKKFYVLLWEKGFRGGGWHYATVHFAKVDRIIYFSYRILQYSIYSLVSAILLYFILNFKINLKRTIFISTFLLILFDLSKPYLSLLKEALKLEDAIKNRRIEVVEFLKRDKTLFRISAAGVIPYDISMINELYEINGYASLTLKKYNEFMNLVARKPGTYFPYYLVNYQGGIHLCNYFSSNLLNILNVKYLLPLKGYLKESISEEQINTRYKVIYEKEDICIFENKDCLPRFFCVNKYEVEKDERKKMDKLYSETFDYKNIILLEEEPELKYNSEKNLDYNISEIEYDINEIKLKIRTNQNCLLFMSENYYPDWYAYINNKLTKIYIANHTFRAIEIPEGEHSIIMKFKPKSFYQGFYLTLCGIGLIIILIILKIFKFKFLS
ncbi:MAG TPA: YfhO family protein [bacterium]|nr:YfhO family protein [bacterium]HOL48844.1 YfhO family protein [bacterium]HPQ19720.1 YfhO family protein [bacterium]